MKKLNIFLILLNIFLCSSFSLYEAQQLISELVKGIPISSYSSSELILNAFHSNMNTEFKFSQSPNGWVWSRI